jgi:hypothetical protein
MEEPMRGNNSGQEQNPGDENETNVDRMRNARMDGMFRFVDAANRYEDAQRGIEAAERHANSGE